MVLCVFQLNLLTIFTISFHINVSLAYRAASIILHEDNCHFLRVDKDNFNRIMRDVEANTVRLKEHDKVVLVLQRIQGAYSQFK